MQPADQAGPDEPQIALWWRTLPAASPWMPSNWLRADIVGRPAPWLSTLRRYLAVIAIGNLAWEVLQLPLYALWRTGSWHEIAFAVIHCTGGDVLIAGASLLGGLLLLAAPDWPRSRFMPVAACAVAFGFAYTVYSEHLNLARNAWAYSDLMPVLPGLGTGLAPLAQWLVVPLMAFAASRPASKRRGLDLPTMAIPTSKSTPDPWARPDGRAS